MNTKRILGLVLIALVSGLGGIAYDMHEDMNAAYTAPTWNQSTVTVDWGLATYANEWMVEGLPFIVRDALPGETADITFDVKGLNDMAGGEATRTMDGDTIVSCHVVLDPSRGVDFGAIRHELGHCFGLSHDNGYDDSLMYWIQGGDSGSEHVTDRDRANLAAIYAK